MSDFVHKPRDCFRSDGLHKHTYTRKEAKRRARQMGKGVDAYRCYHCGSWHLGNRR